jgi:hypothetical protein
MTPSNITTLEKHYHHWITLRDGQYLRGLNIHEREDMLRVLREEFWPGYTYDEWCGSCVADMVKEVYSRYDKWKAEQPKEEPVFISEEEILKAHQVPIEIFGVAATFPAHDKPEEVPEIKNIWTPEGYTMESTDKTVEIGKPNKKHHRK